MKGQLSMEDFSHLSEEQLNSLTAGANFLFTKQPSDQPPIKVNENPHQSLPQGGIHSQGKGSRPKRGSVRKQSS